MTRLKNILAAAVLGLAAPAALAQTAVDFDDVETVEGLEGSEVYTSDGKLFGTLDGIDIDGEEASMILEPANKALSNSQPIFVTAQEGTITFADDRLTLNATETELETSLRGGANPSDQARIILTD